MIDHTLIFPDEATAMLALLQYMIEGGWDMSLCIPGATVAGHPGWGIVVGRRDQCSYLSSLPECVSIVERETGTVLAGSAVEYEPKFA